MAISLSNLFFLGSSVTEVISTPRRARLYDITGLGFNNAGAGIKIVSGSYSVTQDFYDIGSNTTDHFQVIESQLGINLPLSSPNHSHQLVVFDSTGDGTGSIGITFSRKNTSVIDVVAASADLTGASIFSEFVAMGATITDGQQLQYENIDDSGNSISYSASGIPTYPTGVRSTHRVCLWDSGTLYEKYVTLQSDGLANKPNISIGSYTQGETPLYDGRSLTIDRPSPSRPIGSNLWDFTELNFIGACKVPLSTYNDGTLSGVNSAMFHYDNARNSIFVTGQGATVQAGTLLVGEFSIPTMVDTADLSAMNTATNVQGFYNPFANCTEGNSASLDRITGIYSNGSDSELIVNAINWYDTIDRPETTVCINDKTNIAASSIDGLYDLEGGRSAAGWIGSIPAEDQAAFGCAHFYGYSANDSIDSSLSIGPSCRGIDLSDITSNVATNGAISSTDIFMNFPWSGSGDTSIMNVPHSPATTAVFNKLTRIRTMAFIPNSDSVLCIGDIRGIVFNEQYKIKDDAGTIWNGNAPFIIQDAFNYYWLFKKSDMLAAKAGSILPSDIQPYSYGVLDIPVNQITESSLAPQGFSSIKGASFDPIGNHLYLLVAGDLTNLVLLKYEV